MVAFHPIIQKWFAERYGKPTDIQALAWPRIALGQHLLITAPTGSGKTLTAFLWALNRFATGDLATGKTRILYISPLKALNNDIRKNLIDPLTELRSLFDAADTPFPDINVATRSGDTAASERSRMLRKPPEILITTPESLNLLLSSRGGKNLLYDIDTLILDEIHAVVDSKRGVYFMYMTDTPKATKTSNLREDLLQEVVSGHFFDHIPGPQFMTPHSLRYFQEDSCDQVLFLNAADPISPSGLGLGIHGDHLPRRIASNYLVLHGDQLVLSVAKRGKELRFYVEHDASDIDRYLDVLHHLTHRSFRPIKQLRIETINSEAAVSSPYLACIEDRFNIIRDYKSVVIQRAFQ